MRRGYLSASKYPSASLRETLTCQSGNLNAIGDPFDTVFDQFRAEVDEQTQSIIEKAAIGKHLLRVDTGQLLDRLQFHKMRSSTSKSARKPSSNVRSS